MRQILSPKTLRRANRWKLASLILVLVVSFVLLVTVENLLVSSLIAFVFSYLLGPVVNYLERQGISRRVATSSVFTLMAVVVGLIVAWLAPYLGVTVSRLQSDMPRYIDGLAAFTSEVEARVHAIAGPLSSNVDVTARVQSQLTAWTNDFFEHLPAYVKTFLTVMLLGPFLAFFMIKDGRNVLRTLMGLVPNDLFETALSLQHQINFQIGQFVRARLLECLIVGVITALGLVMVSCPYPLLLGVIAGLTNLIPYLGPLLGAVPAFLVALVNGYSSLQIVGLAAVYLAAQLFDAGVLIPVLVAKIVDLHPVTVIVVIIAGAQMMGVLGMIISIPVAATLKVTVNTVYRHLIDTRT